MYFFQMDQATTLGGERKCHGTKSDLSLICVSKSFTYLSLLNPQSNIIVIPAIIMMLQLTKLRPREIRLFD